VIITIMAVSEIYEFLPYGVASRLPFLLLTYVINSEMCVPELP
jgi:hypothetical protein